jgi:hypothetical protein
MTRIVLATATEMARTSRCQDRIVIGDAELSRFTAVVRDRLPPTRRRKKAVNRSGPAPGSQVVVAGRTPAAMMFRRAAEDEELIAKSTMLIAGSTR